jgi:hypothetical protein
MLESSVYNESDLRPFQSRLAELRQVVKDDAKNQPTAMIQLIERKLTQCGEYFYLAPPHTHTFQTIEQSPFTREHRSLVFALDATFQFGLHGPVLSQLIPPVNHST